MTAAADPPQCDDGSLRAEISLGRARARVGVDRIALLAALRDTGSITAAARTVGLSYKAAWDAVQVMNTLFDTALVTAAPGGRAGGGARLTPAGRLVIDTFHAAQAQWAGAASRLEIRVAAPEPASLPWSPSLRTSARNTLHGTVGDIRAGVVDATVVLRIAEGLDIVATITRASVDTLGLVKEMPAVALIKSSFVELARADAPPDAAGNRLPGTIATREDGPRSSEITLALVLGNTLTATVTRTHADALTLIPGTRAVALVRPSDVILAVE